MQVAQVAVPLLMHSAGLPGGADVLWKALDEDFHSEDWRVRTRILVFLLFSHEITKMASKTCLKFFDNCQSER